MGYMTEQEAERRRLEPRSACGVPMRFLDRIGMNVGKVMTRGVEPVSPDMSVLRVVIDGLDPSGVQAQRPSDRPR